jgi:hypothetical protein
MIQDQFLRALRTFHLRLETSGVNWVVTGSLGMALQGMDIAVHDMDIQTDKAGAYEIEWRLSEYAVKPVRYTASDRMRSYLGLLELDGVQVEVMGDIQKRLGDQTWEEPVRVERYKQWVDIDGLRIPVLSLDYEYEAYRAMGRSEKAEMLRKWLEGQKGRS